MITDNALRMATLESIPNGGTTGGLGGNTVTGAAATPFYIDMGSSLGLGMNISDPSSLEGAEMCVTIGTAFTQSVLTTLEFRLVSVPILPTSLTSATTSGKTLGISASITYADDLITVASGLNLPLGLPVYFTGTQGATTTLLVNTVYFLIPISATTYKVATSLANALAGNVVNAGGADATWIMNFIPFIHATTGPISSAFLGAGARFVACVQPYANGPTGKLYLNAGQTVPQPLGSTFMPGVVGTGGGPSTTQIITPGRYLCLHVVPSATLSSGTYTVDLCLNSQSAQRHWQSGFEVR